MLIGKPSRQSNLERIRRIKQSLHSALELPEEATITLNELACLEEGCEPIETVIGLLRPSQSACQYTLHKGVEAIDASDLARVCKSWGFDVNARALSSFTEEN
ncbi:MAG: hypothetical protein AAF542_19915 [Pseudomonadota bacterium]